MKEGQGRTRISEARLRQGGAQGGERWWQEKSTLLLTGSTRGISNTVLRDRKEDDVCTEGKAKGTLEVRVAMLKHAGGVWSRAERQQ